jgi:6,7-dimethyl-8-ribityllumazine synthase
MKVHEGGWSGDGVRLGIVAARFNENIVNALIAGALDTARRCGAPEDAIEVVRVPGAFEVPVAAGALAATGRVDAVVCLGAVIRGDTPHFDMVAGHAAAGVAKVALQAEIPVIFGVLATDTVEQAEARAGGKLGNAGATAVLAALEMVAVMRSVRHGS